MAEQRQPDYDFFGPGQRPQQQPGRRLPPPQGAPPSYGAPPPPLPYGAPPPPSPPPYGAPPQRTTFAPPPAFQQGPLPPAPYLVPRRSRALTALIVAAVVVVAFVGLGIVAAIAIPVFLNQHMRAEWRSTTVALPPLFDGGTRTDIPASAMPAVPSDEAAAFQIATYRTRDGVTFLVLAAKGKEPLSQEEQQNARRDMIAGFSANGVAISLAETDAGKLGGWFGCGAFGASPGNVCVGTDSASAVLVVVSGSADATADARRMREAVVRR